MSQPSDKPTEKRAAELRVGDFIHDGRGIGPVEVAYTQEYRNAHGDQRVLLVTADAATSHHMPSDVFPLATKAEMADAQRVRDRARVIADIRKLADWYEQHPDVPAPISVNVTVSIEREQPDNASKREAIRVIGAAMGVEVVERHHTVSATYVVADYDPARVEVKAALWLDKEPEPVEPQPEPEFAPQDQTLPHYEAGGWKGGGTKGGCGVECACGTTFDGFDSLAEASALLKKHIDERNAVVVVLLEQPLDSIPEDFGADHQPQEGCCEDCDAELDDADAAEMDDHAADAESTPVYADSVNGEEL